MIDRGNFRKTNANYEFPQLKPVQQDAPDQANGWGSDQHAADDPSKSHPNCDIRASDAFYADRGVPTLRVTKPTEDIESTLNEEDFLLSSPTLYGFSLADKLWRKWLSTVFRRFSLKIGTVVEFNVELVSPINWNDEAFRNLVLPGDRKMLLQSLVEAHNNDLGFDDFVQGKGHGLVINLFGPPGVGKTLSAEATSEHVRRPLYVVGGGDVGTDAATLDETLKQVFDIATSWKAIVLIDEVCSTSLRNRRCNMTLILLGSF
jgi:hypothetical protein